MINENSNHLVGVKFSISLLRFSMWSILENTGLTNFDFMILYPIFPVNQEI